MKSKTLIKKILFISFVFVLMFISFSFVAADSWDDEARNWFRGGETNTYLDENVLSSIASLVEVAGTAVIAIATVVVGIKYVLGSVTEKASAKENLITLLVACIFFFGWSNIRSILITGVTFTNSGTVSNIDANNAGIGVLNDRNGFEGAFKNVFGIVLTVAQIIALLVTVYMGVKYIFSGAEGKAKLKEKGVSYIIGIIMIFTTLNFIKFISDAINNAF